MSVAVNFVGGIPFQLLYDAVKLAIRKSRKFRTQLISLQSTLDHLEPSIIQGIENNNVQLHLPIDVIQGLRTKMEEGKRLVDMVLELSMWNIRIWGNCYNCLGPDWAEQLGELDRSLKRLIALLDLEAKKNITDLISLEIANKDRLEKLDKKLELVLHRMEQNNATGRTAPISVVGGQVGSSSGGSGATPAPAPALGVVFQQLFAVVTEVNIKNMMFKGLLERFKSTLHCLQPLIEEIAKSNRILHLSKEEVKNLSKQLKNGVELVHKCSKVRKRASYRKNEYTTKILNLNNCLQRVFIRLKVQVEKNVKEASDSANRMEAVIRKIETGSAVQIYELGSKGHSPVEPGSPIVVRDVLQSNIQGPRDVIKETLVDSARILIDQKGVKPNERSDVVQKNKMETAVGLFVSDSPTARNIELVDSTRTEKWSLELARNIDKMEVDEIKGNAESPIEIAAAESLCSPTVVESTRNAKVSLKQSAKDIVKRIWTPVKRCSSEASESLPSSSSAVELKYDVFLSFRGPDTRRSITSDLFHRLRKERGITTFMDDSDLEVGAPISSTLLTAIEESRFAIVVLSPNYASSTRCLDELTKICECMKDGGRILPLFYNVEPYDVRHQKGSFREAFEKHEMSKRHRSDKVEQWRHALNKVASYSGWDTKNFKTDRELVNEIVDFVASKVRDEATTKYEVIKELKDDEVTVVAVGDSLSASATNNSSWLSPSGDFALGFCQLENDDHFLLSIWFAKIPEKTIVWYANGDRPAPKGSVVNLTAIRGLVLTTPQGEQLWKSDLTIDGLVAHGVLNDKGNFVLQDKKSEKLWETFKNPTDTMLPGQIIERGGRLFSRQSKTNYARGHFQIDFQEDGDLVFTAKKPFHSTATTRGTVEGSEGLQLVFDDSGNFYIRRVNGGRFTFTAHKRPAKDYYLRLTLNSDGVLAQYYLPKSSVGTVGWKPLWSEPDVGPFDDDVIGLLNNYGFAPRVVF